MLKHKEGMDSIPNIQTKDLRTKDTQFMTCDKNNKKETLRRTQGLTINQTTMMEMTSNAYKRKDWKQTGIARKDNFETNHKLILYVS